MVAGSHVSMCAGFSSGAGTVWWGVRTLGGITPGRELQQLGEVELQFC
jgi:hypothetical protein